MSTKMEALEKNRTWEIVEFPKRKNLIRYKWVFTMKYKVDKSIERYKLKLIVKGYSQTYVVDYLETFAPIAKMNRIRLLLSLVVNSEWSLQQFDVKNAFLHGDLEEEIYMEVPPRFENPIKQRNM